MWGGLSRHITELELVRLSEVDLLSPPLLPIPFSILYIAPHTLIKPVDRPRNRVDKAAYATDFLEHEKEADYMRGLSASDQAE